MKKIIMIFVALMTLLSVTACQKNSYVVSAVNSTIDGNKSVTIKEPTELTAKAVVPEGMVVDYWEVDGFEYRGDHMDTFAFTADAKDNKVIEARLRPELKVTTINAEMYFLDEKGKVAGDPFTEFVFEEEYENPNTKEVIPGGLITVVVSAVIPKGYKVDYWLVNGVPYHFSSNVTSFTVEDLDETTEYEVVLKEIVTYYTVKCTYCTFSGGGYNKASEGRVPAGTKITVYATYQGGGWWTGSYVKGEPHSISGVKKFTYTVNKNCEFMHNDLVN